MIDVQFGNSIDDPICLALGFFDSVHAGHRMIVERMKEYATLHSCKAAIFTFNNNAYRLFNPQGKEVYTFDERKTIFEALGIDVVLHAKFDKFFKETSASEFIETLFKTLKIKCIFCGYDYLFGSGGKGDIEFLKIVCSLYGVKLEVTPEIVHDSQRVSTTVIKDYLTGGNIDKANMFLAQPFFIDGTVVSGRNVGHLYNMPTANLSFAKDKLLPKRGVYGTYAYVDKIRYKAVTNVGAKPTFNESALTVETLLDGFNEDIYGKKLRVEFITYLRDIKKFSTPVELSNQIRFDINWRENA